MSKTNNRKSLRARIKSQIDKTTIEAFVKELTSESDRACALIAAANLDNTLREFFQSKFAYLDEKELISLIDAPHAMLSSFSNKIDLAYAMNEISKDDRNDLVIIKRVRNFFAHSAVALEFTYTEISNECDKLSSHDSSFSITRDSHPRAKFISASLSQHVAILTRSVDVLKIHTADLRAVVNNLRKKQ